MENLPENLYFQNIKFSLYGAYDYDYNYTQQYWKLTLPVCTCNFNGVVQTLDAPSESYRTAYTLNPRC